MMTRDNRSARLRGTITWLLAVLILVPSLLGFGAKFLEFMRTFQQSADGAFAITPMVNYLLATIGFFCLLLWASVNGMFRDVERAKFSMLEREQWLEDQHAVPPVTKELPNHASH